MPVFTHSCSAPRSGYSLWQRQLLRHIHGTSALTHHSCQHDKPCPDIEQSLDDLILLEMLVLSAALVVSHALEGGDTFLGGEGASVDRRVWKPNDDAYTDQDSKAAQEEVNDLVRSDGVPIVEGDTVRNEASENLGQACDESVFT